MIDEECTGPIGGISPRSTMKKIFFCLALLFVSTASVYSQYDPQFSQYMFHNSAFNPAAVGESDLIEVVLHPRRQWVGMDSTESVGGNILNFSINSPIKIGDGMHGAGFRFVIDEVGLFKSQNAYAQFAYKKALGSGRISLGADIGFVSVGFRGSKVLKISLGDYHRLLEDKVIPQIDASGTKFDMNVGAFYSTPVYYAGLSFNHITSPSVWWTENSEHKVRGTAYLTGGYLYTFPDNKYLLKSSGLFKTDYTTFQAELSSRLEYDNKYWGGLSYRFQDAVVFLAGLNVAGGLSIGYAFDLPTTHIESWGSHEIVMSYNFAYVFGQRSGKYKSIRIL